MKDIMKMMKQAQELQSRMQKLQDDLAALTVEGQAGAGLVKATLNGKGELRGIAIDASILKPEEKEIVEDLVVAAIQDGRGKAERLMQEKMQEVAGGLPLPPGMKLF